MTNARSLSMNLVAAGVRRLILIRDEVRASSRRLLPFKGSTLESSRGILTS